jgi:hypothetical protein
LRPGTTTTLAVWRNRRTEQLNVRVGELQEPRAEKTANRDRGTGKSAPSLGLAVRPLTAEERSGVGADDGGLARISHRCADFRRDATCGVRGGGAPLGTDVEAWWAGFRGKLGTALRESGSVIECFRCAGSWCAASARRVAQCMEGGDELLLMRMG